MENETDDGEGGTTPAPVETDKYVRDNTDAINKNCKLN
jgi:hypothetical protein